MSDKLGIVGQVGYCPTLVMSDKDLYPRLSFRLPVGLADRLAAAAKSRGVSRGSVVVEALGAALGGAPLVGVQRAKEPQGSASASSPASLRESPKPAPGNVSSRAVRRAVRDSARAGATVAAKSSVSPRVGELCPECELGMIRPGNACSNCSYRRPVK